MLYQPVSQWHSLHFELLIELVAKKLTELWRFKNLAYFFTWWASSMTYLFVNVTYWNCSPIPYVDQVWWWYVKVFMSYAWQNWQTDRQTNRQTNILAKNCKFWQVTKRKAGSRLDGRAGKQAERQTDKMIKILIMLKTTYILRHHYLLSRLFSYSDMEKTSKLRFTALCAEFTGDQWIPHTNGQ